MSSFKADCRFTQRYDDLTQYSDECSDEGEIPNTLKQTRSQWIEEHYDAIEELFHFYMHSGRAYFGNSFFQCGDLSHFADFVFKYTQPGATQ